MDHIVTTEAELEAIYGRAEGPAVIKEIDHVSDHYRRFIALSPFVVIATVGPEGTDCTPRGDPPGFVRVADPRTLLLPDRRGNNRIDTLRNLVRDPRIALLFLVPGIGRTLRVNGRGRVSVDPALCASFAVDGKAPRSVIAVAVERVYTQCAKALVRSALWDPARHVAESALPSGGTIMQALSAGFDAEAYDRSAPQRLQETIY